ncbi:hypothetical protein WAF17_05795 [Bernardetia sp. ABR2-2B]|uniref:hypothetical protein n=1 Tax=Bernardetia sp. ABR2-2B TaxID=3127472 RepID=UPI0030D0E336
MNFKAIISIFLILMGIIGLVVGVFGIFGQNLSNQNPWIFAILGLIFFASGMGLFKTTSGKVEG